MTSTVESRDFLHFRELVRDGARLMEDILVDRYCHEVAEAPGIGFPDAPPQVIRTQFRIRAEITPYSLQHIHQSGGILRQGDFRIMCPMKLVGAVGDEDAANPKTRADIVTWRNNKYLVYDTPTTFPIDGGQTLWVGTLRLVSLP